MDKLIKKLRYTKKKEQKYRELYIKWLAREQDAARALQMAYYSDENIYNIALELLHEYGLSREVMEEDEDEHDTKAG